jgi:branched-subunit amino acid aminotransferase/4-amino-4-deoxychorismate lyase
MSAPAGEKHFFVPEQVPRRPRRRFALALARVRLGSANWDARHKTLSYLAHWQARHEAESCGMDEAVLLNETGALASAAMANLFWARGGQLRTPAREAGCREGVVRGWVMTAAAASGICVLAKTDWHPDELTSADEIFVTNSLLGIQPVTSWNGNNLKLGPIARGLASAYAKRVLAK